MRRATSPRRSPRFVLVFLSCVSPSSGARLPARPSAAVSSAPVCLNPDRSKSGRQSFARRPHVIRTTPITKYLAKTVAALSSAPARQVNSPARTNRLASLNINIHSRTVVTMVNPRAGFSQHQERLARPWDGWLHCVKYFLAARLCSSRVRGLICESGFRRRPGLEELLFTIDQSINVVRGELDIMAVGDGVGRACFHAIAAKDASRIINIVNLRIALAGRHASCFGVFRSFNVNAICRTGGGAEKTADAFFKSILVALENVYSTITWLNARRHIRIGYRRGLAEHRPQSHAEPFVEGKECFSDFFYN